MNGLPERNYKYSEARKWYAVHKSMVEQMREAGRESEIPTYLAGKIEATDEMEREAEKEVQLFWSKKKKWFGLGFIIFLSVIALYWGVWAAIGTFVLSTIIVAILLKIVLD